VRGETSAKLTFVEYFEGSLEDGTQVSGVACSFCGESVDPGFVDPVMLTITARCDHPRDDGIGTQMSWCHSKCLEATGVELHVTRRDFWEAHDE